MSIFESVLASSRAAIASTFGQSTVKIDHEAAKKFALSLPAHLPDCGPRPIPLRFETSQAKANFFGLLHLLNFGSGYRKELHTAIDRGAFETIVFGCMSLYISGSALDAKALLALDLSDVASSFGLPLTVEVEHSPGIIVYEACPLRPHAEQILRVLHETGNRLQRAGYESLGHFILETVSSESPLAATLVERLVSTFPAFADKDAIEGENVYMYKKAQLLAADLYRNMDGANGGQFGFTDINTLTVFADNVLPAVLRKLGVIVLLDQQMVDQIDAGLPFSASYHVDTILRAASIVACDDVLKMLPEGADISARALDNYLWELGKDPEYRSLERHYTQDTVYY